MSTLAWTWLWWQVLTKDSPVAPRVFCGLKRASVDWVGVGWVEFKKWGRAFAEGRFCETSSEGGAGVSLSHALASVATIKRAVSFPRSGERGYGQATA